MPTMTMSVEMSIVAITSGVKPGGVSTIDVVELGRSVGVDVAERARP